MGGRRERAEYRFSSLMKQNKKAKICFVIYIAGFFFLNFFCYEVFAKQKKTELPMNNYWWAPLTSRPAASTVCCASNLLAYHELCSAAAVRWEWRSLIEASLGLMTRLDFALAAGPSWNLFSTCAAGLDNVQAALRRCGNLTELDLSRTAGLADTVDRAGELLIKTQAPTLTSLAMSRAGIAGEARPAIAQRICAC